MNPVSLVLGIGLILVIAGAIAWRGRFALLRRPMLLICGLLVLLFLTANLLTPWTWKWTSPNLQVKIFNAEHKQLHEGSESQGFGWSKLDLFSSERVSGPGTWQGARDVIKSSTEAHIASVSPNGVAIWVHYNEMFNETATSFTKVIFIPAHGVTRIDATQDIYVTGSFED